LIVVFGGEGQLGRELAGLAAATDTPLTAFDHLETDITDRESVARALASAGPSVAINAAAYNAVDRAESDLDAAMRINAEGPRVLATACAASGVRLIHVSTDYVFDGEKTEPYREDDAVHPLGAYGRSKAAGEDAVRETAPEHLIVRTAWLFGVHGGNFLKTMVRLAGERDALSVVADQHGTPTSTLDLARGLLTAASAIQRGARPWGTYHLAGSGVTTRYAFASRIVTAQARFTGRAPRIDPVATADYPTPARRPRNSALNSEKFSETFGFRGVDWRDSVDRTVAALFSGGTAQ
jgi:dTDP-4-dehydrorhamnose reductase